MRKIIMALFAVILAAGPAAASDKTDVMATVKQYADSFSKGDVKTALGLCAAQSSVIDEIPPYAWEGATGCADWAKDFDAFAKQNGFTNPMVTLSRPTHVDVTGDRGYVVVPGTFTAKQKGKPFAERGSILTVALQKVAGSWRITGWAWAKH